MGATSLGPGSSCTGGFKSVSRIVDGAVGCPRSVGRSRRVASRSPLQRSRSGAPGATRNAGRTELPLSENFFEPRGQRWPCACSAGSTPFAGSVTVAARPPVAGLGPFSRRQPRGRRSRGRPCGRAACRPTPATGCARVRSGRWLFIADPDSFLMGASGRLGSRGSTKGDPTFERTRLSRFRSRAWPSARRSSLVATAVPQGGAGTAGDPPATPPRSSLPRRCRPRPPPSLAGPSDAPGGWPAVDPAPHEGDSPRSSEATG